jgi:hypothetical protein
MAQLPAPDRKASTASAALRTFFRIAELWGLTAEQQILLLGSPARSTYFRWKKHGAEQLSRDTLERISYVLGIYKALQVLLPDAAAADGWVRRPNRAALFGGRTALDRMLTGNVADLYLVRQYLDAQRAGWP